MSLQKTLIKHIVLLISFLSATLLAHSDLPTSSEYTVKPIPQKNSNLTNHNLESLAYKTNTSQTASISKKNQVPSTIKNYAYTVNLEMEAENKTQENTKIDSNKYVYPKKDTTEFNKSPIETTEENKQIDPYINGNLKADNGDIIIEDQITNSVDSLYTNSPNTSLNEDNITIEEVAEQETQPQKTMSPDIQIDKKISAFLVTNTDGQEIKTPINANTQLKAGDLIEYQSNITNRSKDRVRSMMVNLSIPQEVELIGMIKPDYAMGSIDQQNFYQMPLRTEVNGIAEDIGLESYRAVQWQIESLDLNETTTVSYRAKIK